MQMKPDTLRIPPDDPFAEDRLIRSQSANLLTELFSTIREPFVLAIDSPWGTGKTTFLKMWMALLKSKGFTCLSFNAWDSDFTGDPLVSFIGETRSALDVSSKDADSATAVKEYVSTAKKLLETLAKKSAPLAIKLLSQGLLDLQGLKDTGIAELAESMAKEKIEEYEADKKTIVDFKAQLKKFVDHLTQAKRKDDLEKPLIFIIDELDRCRPTYSIDLLEKLKHFFNIENIIFVLAIDKVQLGHSIRSIYGSEMDVDGYLRRFIDLDFRFPDPPRGSFCGSLYERFKLRELATLRSDGEKSIQEFVEALSCISDTFQLSLRTIEQCFGQFNVIYRTTPRAFPLFGSLVAFLIALRAKNPPLYRSFVSGKPDIDRVASFINESARGKEYWDSFYGFEIEAHYVMSKATAFQNPGDTDKYRKVIEQYGRDSPQGKRANRVLELINYLEVRGIYDGLKFMINRIELVEQFS